MISTPRPSDPRSATALVVENRPVVEGIHEIVLRVPIPWGPALAGQFVQLHCPPRESFGLPRPFSLADCRLDGAEAVLSIVYGVVGGRTQALARMRAGETIDLVGPLGRPFTRLPGRRPVLVGGGRGIAPILMLARQWSAPRADDAIDAASPQPLMIYGARSASMLVPVDAAPCPLWIATDDGSAGSAGSVLDLLEQLAGRGELVPARDAIHACGPNVMLAALSRWCEPRGIPCQVSLETHFGCGLGICAGCAIPLRAGTREASTAFDRFVFACREGPVFDAAQVEWEGVHE